MTRVLTWLVGLIGGLGLALAGLSVITRYAFPAIAFDWSDEVVVMLLVWAMLLSGFRLTIQKGHVAVDLLTHVLKPRARRLVDVIATLGLALYAGLLAVSGTIVTLDAVWLGERTESTLRTPAFIYFAAMPVAMALIVIAAVIVLVRRPLAPEHTTEPL